jgi:hypothetical protein
VSLWTGWKSKPPQGTPLDATNDLNRGLVYCFPFNEGSGPPINLVRAYKATIAGTATWSGGTYGPALSVTGSNYFSIPQPGNDWVMAQAATLRIIHNPNYSASFSSVVDAGTSGGSRDLSIFLDTNGNIDYQGYADTNYSTTFSTGMAKGSWWDFVTTINGTSGAVIYYVNGAQIGTLSGSGFSAVSAPAYFGNNISTGGVSYVGAYALVQYWNRILSAQEIAALHTDPWQIFAPPVPFWWGDATAASIASFYWGGSALRPTERRLTRTQISQLYG